MEAKFSFYLLSNVGLMMMLLMFAHEKQPKSYLGETDMAEEKQLCWLLEDVT